MYRETLTLGVVPNKRSFLSMVEAKRQKDCFMEEIRKIKASIVEIVDIDDICENGIVCEMDKVNAIVDKMKNRKIDALFFPFCDFGEEQVVAAIASKFTVPILIWGPRDERPNTDEAKAKVKDILTYATENKFGVAAINTLNIETVKYVIEAAERERVPIIVQFYPGFSDYTDLKHLAFAACDMAEKASIPVGVHLDHSVTYEIAVGGIRDGFPSVMIDGSTKSFQENVELTKNVVRVAKVFGVDVEAELGHVGNGDSIDAIDNTNYYTKVEDAVRFVEQTGCDSLAIAVGNAHGPYVKTPNLDLERIYAIRKKVNIPLVLHGCSDIPEEQMKEAVNLGMSKFNIATEYFRTMYQSIEKRINNQEFEGNGVKLMYDIKEEMIDFVIQKIRLLNPNKYSM